MNRTFASIDDVESPKAFSGRHRAAWIWMAFICLGFGLFFAVWRGPMPFEGTVRALAAKDAWSDALTVASNPVTVRRYYSLSVGLAFLTLGFISLGAILWARLSETIRTRIYEVVFTLALSCAMLFFLSNITYEGPWLRLSVLMHDPSSVPIFGHRLLFVWIATALQRVVPHLSDLRSFYLSQWIASVLAFAAIRKWSTFFVDRSFSWAGQVLALILMGLCLDYYVFYDIGVVFFSACALIAIYSGRYWLLVPVVLIGTLNYEGTLLLIPLAAFTAYKEPVKRWLPAVTVSFAAYCIVRFALQKIVPIPSHFEWRVWSNLSFPYVFHRQIASVLFKGLLWFLLGLMSFPYCSPRLKRLTLLFPLNFLTSFLFGKLNEIRLFEACIPVLVAMMLSASMRRFELGGAVAVRANSSEGDFAVSQLP